jgi:argininosuccinate lyase
MMTTLKGLPVGYSRDLQEDKSSYLEAAALTRECLEALTAGFSGVRFREERLAAALSSGATQATDLAEALVRRGVAFREAYRAVGKLVQAARVSGKALDAIGAAELAAAEGLVSVEDLSALSARRAQQAKEIPGGTGPQATGDQMDELKEAIAGARARVQATPRLASLIATLAQP